MNSGKTSLNTVELIADSIRIDILKGKRQIGDPLPQDEMAAQFNVSKIPVREALHLLKNDGLVIIIPNKGVSVSALSAQEVDEIYTIRIALETIAIKRAIPQLTILKDHLYSASQKRVMFLEERESVHPNKNQV